MSLIASNGLWALDFQFDPTEDNRTLKLVNIVDEFTRECPAIVVERSIDADRVVATLDRLVVERAHRPSCALTTVPSSRGHSTGTFSIGVGHVYIRPATPRLKGSIERSHRIDAEEFYRLLEGVVIDDTGLFFEKLQEWEDFYNLSRPTAASVARLPTNGLASIHRPTRGKARSIRGGADGDRGGTTQPIGGVFDQGLQRSSVVSALMKASAAAPAAGTWFR
jgi:transposase InsO family protein